jgi:hypothetical protein
MAEEQKYDEALADGGDGAVTAEQLQGLKDAASEWNTRSQDFWTRRVNGENARFCRWNGQSPDGRFWAENNGGTIPTPFEGASDQRVKWADSLVAEKVRTLMVAMMRAQPRCEGRGNGDAMRAKRSTALLRWMIDRMGLEWLRQWKILLNHAWADSPAVAMMSVEWEKRTEIEIKTVTADELAQMYADVAGQGGGADPQMIAQAAQDFKDALLMQQAGEAEMASMVQQFFPDVKPARARKIVRQMRKDGAAEFPYPRVAYEGPKVVAKRYGNEFIIPDNARLFQEATPWFTMEWVTEQELKSRQLNDGWDGAFIEDVLKHEGEACFNEWAANEQGALMQSGPDAYKGLYQLVYAYYVALNEDDSPARYLTVMHTGSDKTADGRTLIRDAHGSWPAVVYQTDVTDGFMLNARGIPEEVSPLQSAMKGIIDNGSDANTIWSLPPILSFGIEQHGTMYLDPLKIIKGKRDSRFEAMQGPQMPTQGAIVAKQLERLRDWKHGRPNAEDSDGGQGAAVTREEEVVWFLQHVRDVCRMMLALARQNASEELLVRVTDAAGDQMIRNRSDIEGEFDVRLIFDPADLDFENSKNRLELVKNTILSLDSGTAINRAVLVQTAFRSVFPYMPDEAIQDVGKGEGEELKDEARNYSMLRAGVMPTLDTDGNWNYQLRRQWYDQLSQQNPNVFSDMGEDKKAMLVEWLKGLEQQATQYGTNVQVGRTGMSATETGVQPTAEPDGGQMQ